MVPCLRIVINILKQHSFIFLVHSIPQYFEKENMKIAYVLESHVVKCSDTQEARARFPAWELW